MCPGDFKPRADMVARLLDPFTLTSKHINDALKKFPYSLAEHEDPAPRESRRPTTYSFRRHAIQRFTRNHTDSAGNVDWAKVILLTGHIDATMPRNIYNETAAAQAEESARAEDEELRNEVFGLEEDI
jgi:hypothetical protein